MSEGKSAATPQRIVTHEMAREAFRKMHNTLYNHAPKPMLTVPPDPMRDVDLILDDYIRQQSESGSVAAPKAQPDDELMIPYEPLPGCGHPGQYAYTEDGGKHIVCLVCEFKDRVGAPKAGEPPQELESELRKTIADLRRALSNRNEEIVYLHKKLAGSGARLRRLIDAVYNDNASNTLAAIAAEIESSLGAGETPPQELSTWLDTTLWSFVHGALLDLESTTEAHDSLHKHMQGAILAALQVGAGETPAERIEEWPLCDYTRRPSLDKTHMCRCDSCQNFADVIRKLAPLPLPPGAGSMKGKL